MDRRRPARRGRRTPPVPSRAAGPRRARAPARPAPWQSPAAIIGRRRPAPTGTRCRGHGPPWREAAAAAAHWATPPNSSAARRRRRAHRRSRAVGFSAASRCSNYGRRRGKVGLGEQQQVGAGRLRGGLGDTVQCRRAGHGIDRRHDAVEPQRLLEERIGRQRVEDGPGIGEAAGLQRHAPERRQSAACARSQQPVERVGQALAHGAADAAVGQLDDFLVRRFQQQMVEARRRRTR